MGVVQRRHIPHLYGRRQHVVRDNVNDRANAPLQAIVSEHPGYEKQNNALLMLTSSVNPRKWKEKLKEWNFEKNLSKNEMKIVIAKAERRTTEEGKDTVFFHHGNMIPPAKVSAWKRRVTSISSSPFNPYASEYPSSIIDSPLTSAEETPATIAYFTPYCLGLSTTLDGLEQLVHLDKQPIDSLAGIDESEADLKVAAANFFVFEAFNRGKLATSIDNSKPADDHGQNGAIIYILHFCTPTS
ncbi:hypothetical protein EG329_007621 [Mollisiaceae sp. DMI_Dod_QoI]|nr:hypothetical protein EG329_007621 [Helotiales sp. DMI_Dod_QoI]